VAHIKLAASRAFLLVAYFTQTHEMLFDAHARGFAVFGGLPARGIYDNMKTVVDKIGKGKQRSVNARFEAMTGHYLFDHEFCNRAAGWEKGIVEKNVQDRRRGVIREATERRWGSLAELNEWLQRVCREAWEQVSHPEWPELGIADVWQDEASRLMPCPKPFDGYVEHPVRVSSTSLIQYHATATACPANGCMRW
jgi:transposase